MVWTVLTVVASGAIGRRSLLLTVLVVLGHALGDLEGPRAIVIVVPSTIGCRSCTVHVGPLSGSVWPCAHLGRWRTLLLLLLLLVCDEDLLRIAYYRVPTLARALIKWMQRLLSSDVILLLLLLKLLLLLLLLLLIASRLICLVIASLAELV